MKKKKPISEEQHYLCEIGLEKMPYRSSWLFKSYTEESHTHITITAYYNVDEAFLQASTAAWGIYGIAVPHSANWCPPSIWKVI